jgi:hypothetical protein
LVECLTLMVEDLGPKWLYFVCQTGKERQEKRMKERVKEGLRGRRI